MAITVRQIEWAAGFLEGEGCFQFSKAKNMSVTATQVQKEPLERLQSMFGGSIYGYQPREPNKSFCYRWCAVGTRAVGICMTLYSLMSPKRKVEILKVIDGWRKKKVRNKFSLHCDQGHPFDEDNTYWHNGQRYCRACRGYHEQIRKGWRKPPLWENRYPGETQNFQCKRGHPYVDENIYLWNGKRYCKLCRSIQMGEWRQKQKSKQVN